MASEDAKLARKVALAGVRRDFVPVLQAAGFAGKGSSYRRFRDDRVDLVEMQTSKNGGALCVNLAQYPPEGLEVMGKSVAAADVTLVHVNTVRGRVTARLGARHRRTHDVALQRWRLVSACRGCRQREAHERQNDCTAHQNDTAGTACAPAAAVK